MCGIPTTRKDASSVVVKREVVQRERGWRWGGMVVVEVAEVVREGAEVVRVHGGVGSRPAIGWPWELVV